VADIFARLRKERPPQIAETAKPQPRKSVLRARLKTLLMDVLANGPVPTTIVYERGAAHGFTKKQLWATRVRMKIVAFKEEKYHGRWFLALPHQVQQPDFDPSDYPSKI
jgi:hypothetical protein